MFSKFSVHLRTRDALSQSEFYSAISSSYTPSPLCHHINTIANIRDFLDPFLLPIPLITRPLQFKLTANTSTNEPHLFHRIHPDQPWKDEGRIFKHGHSIHFDKVPSYTPKTLDPKYIDQLKKDLQKFKDEKYLTMHQYAENFRNIHETADHTPVFFQWPRKGVFLKELPAYWKDFSSSTAIADSQLDRLVDVDYHNRNNRDNAISNTDLVETFLEDLNEDDYRTHISSLTLKKNWFFAADPAEGDCE
jgi:hypothetical protein